MAFPLVAAGLAVVARGAAAVGTRAAAAGASRTASAANKVSSGASSMSKNALKAPGMRGGGDESRTEGFNLGAAFGMTTPNSGGMFNSYRPGG